MGTPQDNAKGYEQSAVMTHLRQMRGKLMIVHGLIDENVHFRHSARLINGLIENGQEYELLLFPDERHMPRREADLVYMESRIRDFFQRHL
jgi:dipeptidyl-peptidase-4